LATVRSAVRSVDPQLAIFDAAPFADRVALSTARTRAAVWLCAAFGLSALLLAAIGIYGVSACAVAARTREIGVRLACGAQARDVFGLVVATELRAVAIGAAAGLVAAVAVGRLLASSLFGVPSVDAISLAGGAIVLAVPALVACMLPARRALDVDPVVVLRAEI
jgi:ABC-type antimicrobial peptide transport system permease subunit